MVYIFKKQIGDKAYYYLRASQRKGNQVIAKDIAYLGSTLEEVKHALNNLPRYKEQIRKAYKTIRNFLEVNHYLEKATQLKLKKDIFLEQQLLSIEACRIHYNTTFLHQPVLTKQEILKNFIIEFAFNTTAIEGNTIKLNEARSLLLDGLTPKNKTLREIYDLKNTEKVFLWLLETTGKVTHEFIIKIHKELMENIDPRSGYRTTDVRVIKANFEASPAPYVKIDMDLLLQWLEKNKNKLHPLVLATIFHHKFEKIHPFMDGNGRTGRMILNYILLKNKYPPIVIRTKKRAEYVQALREADTVGLLEIKKERYQKLIAYMAAEMNENYWNIFL
ncbi:Fic family protein [Candidatus Woesearchaeota archaeon]|nr:Fic family protein [Candidatus Woesearchaeota archaeon]